MSVHEGAGLVISTRTGLGSTVIGSSDALSSDLKLSSLQTEKMTDYSRPEAAPV